MSRVLLAVGVVLVVLVALGTAVGWLAYGPAPARDGEIAVPGLGAPVAVAWPETGGVAIEAPTWAAAAAGLGYAHAADHAFEMVLWRQTARGETAAWFGDSARSADLHARRLGLDALARQTYDGLDAPTRALLDSYAHGANAALAQPGVSGSDAFVWLGLAPEPWQPWDALAVERLVAYLATPAPDASWDAAARASPAVAGFVRADATFRRGLGVSGTAFARAFAAGATGGTAVVAHQPAGASALALWVPVAFAVGGRRVAVASVPGTLSLPVGTDGAAAWSVFLTGALRVEPFAGTPPLPVYSRVVARDGDETLVAVARDSSGLVLGPAPRVPSPGPPAGPAGAGPAPPGPASPRSRLPVPPPTPSPSARADTADTARVDSSRTRRAAGPRIAGQWRIRWAGFGTGSDASAFAALAAGRAPGPFTLLLGDGLLATRGDARPLGRPPVVASGTASAFVAGDRTARWAPVRLDTLAARARRRGVPLTAAGLATDAHSPWAAQRLPPLLRALGDRDDLPRALEDPVAFLRSWDGAYTASAIGPSVFEAWLEAHRAFTGHLPDPADSADVALLPYTLRIARGDLRDTYGADPSGWRWGRLRGGVRTPVLGRLAGTAGRRYADAPAGPGGHPTALRPGPALVPDDAPADTLGRLALSPGPAVWSAWTTLGRDGRSGGRLFVRGPRPAGASFGPTEAAFGDPGVTVGIDAHAARLVRRLVLAPAP